MNASYVHFVGMGWWTRCRDKSRYTVVSVDVNPARPHGRSDGSVSGVVTYLMDILRNNRVKVLDVPADVSGHQSVPPVTFYRGKASPSMQQSNPIQSADEPDDNVVRSRCVPLVLSRFRTVGLRFLGKLSGKPARVAAYVQTYAS